ncbi:helix-turn-helix transcriptional regulator [Aquibacillus halophilus]|uniref:helix-turn-helix transcriptional regulator n=1 Tax=Aquibacillus halophilus TaxID=930132 RepID=UPI00129AD731|nr:AAA family ATPase [Aquibacillus halophilus]
MSELFLEENKRSSRKPEIPAKLYGREDESAVLGRVIEKATIGSNEFIFLHGPPGIGKTSLVNQVMKLNRFGKGFYIAGKFDQLKQHTPYESFIHAFKDLVRQILTLPDEQVTNWKRKIMEAVGRNGAVITDIIPELELIIGKQPVVEKVSANDSENRFEFAARKFAQVFTTTDQSFVLFLDDIQWADDASLRLVNNLITDPSSQGFVVIVSYRDNEWNKKDFPDIDPSNYKNEGVNVTDIALDYLSTNDVIHFVSDSLRIEPKSSRSLARLLFTKTAGNPFYLKQLLQLIHHKGWLYYSEQELAWTWDVQVIDQINGPDDIIDYMVEKITRLPVMVREVVLRASCLGNTFSETALYRLFDLPVEVVTEAVQHAVEERLFTAFQDNNKINYQFFHDRIQQAAYQLLDIQEKQQIHYDYGNFLIGELDHPHQISFEIVNHLNRGGLLIKEASERNQLQLYNLLVGLKAKRSAAYQLSKFYLDKAVALQGENGWNEAFDFHYNLFLELAETEYLCGNYARSEQLYKELLKKARCTTEKTKVYSQIIIQYTNQVNYSEAITQGLHALSEIGISISSRPSKSVVAKELLLTKLRLPNDPALLKELPEVSDEKIEAMMELMSTILPATFFYNKEVFAILICKYMRLMVKYGRSPMAPAVIAIYGVLLCTGFSQFEKSFKIGKVAVDLANDSNLPSVKGKVYVVFGGVIGQWIDNPKKWDTYLEEGLELCLSTGDFVYTNMAMGAHINSIYTRESLDYIAEKNRQYQEVLEQTRDDFITRNTRLFMQFSRCLEGHTENRLSLSDADFDETTFFEDIALDQISNITYFQYYTYKTQLHYLYGEDKIAMIMAARTRPFIPYADHMPYLGEYYFYSGLAMLRLGDKIHRKEIINSINVLSKWSKSSKAGFWHKVLLLQAERARLNGKKYQAMDLYDQAISEAKSSGYERNEALANELAGVFYLSLGKDRVGKAYLEEAVQLYQNWGAKLKVDQLKVDYPSFFKKLEESVTNSVMISSNDKINSFNFDLATVMKTVQTVSEKIDLEEILLKLITLVVQRSGAGKGILVRSVEGQLVVKAVVDEERSEIRSEPMDDSAELSKGIARYVARTHTSVNLRDASKDCRFMTDSYIIDNTIHSLLCIPLFIQGKFRGLIYLENKPLPNVFKEEHIQVIQLLAIQAIFVLKLMDTFTITTEDSISDSQHVLLDEMTDRELEILKHIASGMTNQEIAQELGLKVGTVKVHNHNIFSKLDVKHRTKAIVRAKELNLLER